MLNNANIQFCMLNNHNILRTNDVDFILEINIVKSVCLCKISDSIIIILLVRGPL
jgi:hypothetical protein